MARFKIRTRGKIRELFKRGRSRPLFGFGSDEGKFFFYFIFQNEDFSHQQRTYEHFYYDRMMPSDAHLRTNSLKFIYTTTPTNNMVDLEFHFLDCENELIYRIEQSDFHTAFAEIAEDCKLVSAADDARIVVVYKNYNDSSIRGNELRKFRCVKKPKKLKFINHNALDQSYE